MSHVPPRRRGRSLRSRASRSIGLGALLFVSLPALALAAGPTAPASGVRYGRKAGAIKTRTRLDTRAKGEASGASTKKAAPGVDASAYHERKPSVTLAVIDDQIGVARRLVEQADRTSAEFPGFLHRLANLYLDKRAILELAAGELYEKIDALTKSRRGQEAKTLQARQARLGKQARQASAEGARVMAALVGESRYDTYDRRDEVLYDLALAYGQLGEEEKMKANYARLIKDHPQSRFRPHVYVAFADHEFDQGHVADARRLYQQVIDGYAGSPMYAYALYKSAWCELNPDGDAGPDYPRALSRFVQAIDAASAGKAGSEANGRQLRREARRDLVRAYVHAARPSKAWDFFGRVGRGPTNAEDMRRQEMELLAAAYFGEGMYVESTATYRELQDRFVGDASVCQWQSKIVVNALASHDAQIQWKEAQRLVKAWEEVRGGNFDKQVRRHCGAAARDTLVQLATTWHDEANKTRRAEPWHFAAAAYEEYLRLFPKDKEAYELAFYLAEVHWARGEQLYAQPDRARKVEGLAEFEAAHDAFVHVLEMRPKGKLSREAAYAQMLAMKNALEYDETAGPRTACTVHSDGTCSYDDRRARRGRGHNTQEVARLPPREYDEASRRMLEAYATYEQYVDDPKDPQRPKILYHRAKLMVDHNRYDDSRPLLEQIVGDYEGTVYAVWSAEMLLDALTIDWADASRSVAERAAAGDDLVQWATKLEASKTFAHAEATRVRAQVPTLMAAVGWTIAEGDRVAAKAGEDPDGYRKCAQRYVGLYEMYPDHDRPDDLLFNAAICFEAAYLVGNAIKVRRVLLDDHPGSDHYQQTLRATAENYQSIAFYAEAAELLEGYAGKYETDAYTGPALENAFLFRRGLGDDDAAKRDLQHYESLLRRKDPKAAARVFWSEADLLSDAGADADADAQLRHAQEYVARYGKKGGSEGLALAHARIGQLLWERSCAHPGPGGVCVTVTRRKAGAGQATQDAAETLRIRGRHKARKRCGFATQGVLKVHDRDRKLAAKAQDHLARAVDLFGALGDLPEDADQARAIRDSWGMALTYRADEGYERYLRIEMPDKLTFFVEDWKKDSSVAKWDREYAEQVRRRADSTARFGRFLDAKTKQGRGLVEDYARVRGSGSPHWILAAAARSAVVHQNFADQLYRAEIPAELRTPDQVDAYCDTLSDYAAPLEHEAHESFAYCLQRSTEFSFFNEFSRQCEQEMQQRRPDEFPATNELFGRSRYSDSSVKRAGVQLDLDATVGR
jgi:outer membrane protein assembly factor BamD (BamD/ComL family)